MADYQDLEDFDKRKDANNDWQHILKVPKVGPARFIQSSDLHDLSKGPYKRVTRAEAEAGKECRVYADGVYDVFHAGHARQLMQAKNMFPNVILIVGCSNDTLVHSKKGKTVCTDEERYESLRHCRYADIILPSGPWYYSVEFFDRHKIDFIAHDEEPYSIGGQTDSYALPKSMDMFCATQRTEGISTSDVITRIVKNYDGYIRRNLSRGMTRQDLNIGPVHSARLKTESYIKETINHVKDDINSTFRWTESIIKNLADNQVANVRNFLETYAPNSTPQMVVNALDYISPSESPKSRSRSDSTTEDEQTQATGVDPNELAAALEK